MMRLLFLHGKQPESSVRAWLSVYDVAWAIPVSPQTLTVQMGATIRFTWSGVHSLYRAASAADFADCVADSGLGFTPAASGGSEDIVLSAAGTYYFLCNVGTHCEAGQKLAVTVEAPGTPPAASSPAAAGGPSGDDDDDDTGAMVGIIIGAVAAVLIVVVGAVLYMRRQPAADAAAGGPTLKKDVQLTNIA